MEDSIIIIRFILFATPQAIIILACARYLKVFKNLDSKLLLLGSVITFISFVFRSFGYYIIPMEIFDSFTFGIIGGIFNFTGLIGTFLFAFGFLKLIKRHLKNFNSTTHDELNDIGKH